MALTNKLNKSYLMPLGMGSLASSPGSDPRWGQPQGGYITLGGAPKQLPQQGSSLGKYPWLFGDLPAGQMGPQTNDFGFALGQKARPTGPGASVVGRTSGPGKGQNNNLFGQPFKGGIF